MFCKEREIFSVENGLDVMISYIGYDLRIVYERFIDDDKSRDIFLDFEKDFLSFDHFYRFTLVKVFRGFIRTKHVILTLGQLIKYLKMIGFDDGIIADLEKINDPEDNQRERFTSAWDVIISLLKKIGVKRLIIANFDRWKKSSANKTRECEKALYYIIRQLGKVSTRVIVEAKDKKSVKSIFEDENIFRNISFDEHGLVEDYYYDEYYGELALCLDRGDYEMCKEKVRYLLEKHISNARGGSQMMYVAYLLSLSGQRGMSTTSISSLIGITAGACGSVLSRLLSAGIIKKTDRNYRSKNDSFRKIIMETYQI